MEVLWFIFFVSWKSLNVFIFNHMTASPGSLHSFSSKIQMPHSPSLFPPDCTSQNTDSSGHNTNPKILELILCPFQIFTLFSLTLFQIFHSCVFAIFFLSPLGDPAKDLPHIHYQFLSDHGLSKIPRYPFQ